MSNIEKEQYDTSDKREVCGRSHGSINYPQDRGFPLRNSCDIQKPFPHWTGLNENDGIVF